MAKLLFLSAYQLLLYQRLVGVGRRAAGRDRRQGAQGVARTTWTTRPSGRCGSATAPRSRTARMQAAVDELWPYTHELFAADPLTRRLAAAGVDARRAAADVAGTVDAVLGRGDADPAGGRLGPGRRAAGRHTEHLSYLLAEMQVLHRAHPGAAGDAARHDGAPARWSTRSCGSSPSTTSASCGRRRTRDRPGDGDDHPDLLGLPGDGRDPRRHPRRAGRRRPPRRPTCGPCCSPAWTTDWIIRTGGPSWPRPGSRRRRPVRASGVVPLTLAVRCPRCGSPDTEELSRFGSTACKALWRCRACREPFDQVKPL